MHNQLRMLLADFLRNQDEKPVLDFVTQLLEQEDSEQSTYLDPSTLTAHPSENRTVMTMPAAELQHSSSTTDNTFSLLGEAHPQPEDIPEAIEGFEPDAQTLSLHKPDKTGSSSFKRYHSQRTSTIFILKTLCSAKVEWAVCGKSKIFPWADTWHSKRCTGPTHKHRSILARSPNFCTASAPRDHPNTRAGLHRREALLHNDGHRRAHSQGNHQ